MDIKAEYNAAMGEGRAFVDNVNKFKKWDWGKSFLDQYRVRMDTCEASLGDFGSHILLHDKKTLKSMYKEHLLETSCDAFKNAIAVPLKSLCDHNSEAYGMKRAQDTWNLSTPKGKKARINK
jgi:hypothetical protein